jgi:multidrug efflux system membrane fusion protein
LVDTLQNVILIPTPAIQRNAQGAFVYVIKSDQTAAMRSITPGATDGTVTAVDGLEAGDVVATNGFDKLQDGAKVSVRAPANSNGSGQPARTGQSGQPSSPGGQKGQSSGGKKGGSAQ